MVWLNVDHCWSRCVHPRFRDPSVALGAIARAGDCKGSTPREANSPASFETGLFLAELACR